MSSSRCSTSSSPSVLQRIGSLNGSKARLRDLEADLVEICLESDIQFVKLPKLITTSLLTFRRIVVRGDGSIRRLPCEDEEVNCSEENGAEEADPVQRRVVIEPPKKRSRRIICESHSLKEELNVENGNKENVPEEKHKKTDSIVSQHSNSSSSLTGADDDSDGEVEEVDTSPYSALDFSPDQIDRLVRAPLWLPLPRKSMREAQEDMEDDSGKDDGSCSAKNPEERLWEVAAVLRPHVVPYKDGTKGKEYVVLWKDWPWDDRWSLAPECFSSSDKTLIAAETRERLISQMGAYMRQKDGKSFNELFPNFKNRHDYSSWHRVQLRLTEQSINDELEALGIAPIYFENWTSNETASIDLEYLTSCVMSTLNYREALVTGHALRLQYPDSGAGCDCKDGHCTPCCPCLKIMGQGQIRMRRTGKVNADKLSEDTSVECGTTCPCDNSCPSRYAERGRKVPLVVMYTRTKGWSVYAPQVIPAGTFLGFYTGEIIPLCTANAHGISTSYQFKCIQQIPGAKQYVIDASRMGNETRYFNHACGDAANLKAVALLSCGNVLTNNTLFFTKRRIAKGEELTFSYRGKDTEKLKNGIRCLCTPGCQNRL